MTLHENILEQIKDAMRAKDKLKLDTLRGLNALFVNEMLNQKNPENEGKFLSDDKVLAIIKRSVRQRQDSIRQFEIGKRPDLAEKEKAELSILEAFLPSMASAQEIEAVAKKIIGNDTIDPKNIGKYTGMIMKAMAGKADGNAVKAVLDGLLKK